MKPNLKTIRSLKDLEPDAHNANKHTVRGTALMEHSIREYGYGDSMTVDRAGRIISGNQRAETLADLGMTPNVGSPRQPGSPTGGSSESSRARRRPRPDEVRARIAALPMLAQVLPRGDRQRRHAVVVVVVQPSTGSHATPRSRISRARYV